MNVKSLQDQVTKISIDSKNYFSKVITPSIGPLPAPENQEKNAPNAGEFKIPVSQQNAISFDTKNNFAVVKYFEAEKVLVLRINSHDIKFAIGQEYRIVNDQGKRKIMVYKGIENNNYVFLIHD